jgi:hypothetical protein
MFSSESGITFEDKEVQGSGVNSLLVGSTGIDESCVAPVIFTAGLILKVTTLLGFTETRVIDCHQLIQFFDEVNEGSGARFEHEMCLVRA